MAFSPDCYFDGAECDHIDRNPLNNSLDNLRWVSHRENCQNRAQVEKQRDRSLYLIYDDGSVAWYGRRKHTNIPSPTLSRILSGKHSLKYKCRGFYWDQLMDQPADVRKRVIEREILDMIF